MPALGAMLTGRQTRISEQPSY